MISGTIRDIAIILLAIQTLIVNILLAVLIWQIWRMVKMMQGEVKPIVEDTQETLGTVRGTASFIGANVVDPVVRANRTVSGFRASVSSLFADLKPLRSPAPATNSTRSTATAPANQTPPPTSSAGSSPPPSPSSNPPPSPTAEG